MPLIRFQNLSEAYETGQRKHQKEPLKLEGTTSDPNSRVAIASSPSGPEPKIAFESQTPFGKVSITEATLSSIGSSLSTLATNASCQVDT